MNKIFILFSFVLILSFCSQMIFANDPDPYTEKICMDNRKIAEERGYDCTNIEEYKGSKSKSKKSSDGKTPLERVWDLRQKNKNGGNSEPKPKPKPSNNTQTTNGGSSGSTGSCSYTDCIHYNPDNFQIGGSKGKFFIRDGNKYVARSRKLGTMQRVDDYLKYYGVASVCYIGDEFTRPFSIWYKTASNTDQIVPTGPMPGEDCNSFGLNSVDVKYVGGEWKIVDGNRWMFSFGDDEVQARNALCLIKKYKLNHLCFAGSRSTLQYMRK